MLRLLVLMCAVLVAGCATKGPPSVGSTGWHVSRLAEIEAAYGRGEIEVQDYLALKNDADQIRMDYRSMVRQQTARPPTVRVIPIPIHRH